jgi:hypothetical protein
MKFQAKTIHEVTLSACKFISGPRNVDDRIPGANSLISVQSSMPTHMVVERIHVTGYQGIYLIHLSSFNTYNSYTPWRATFSIIINSCKFENSKMGGIVDNRNRQFWLRPPKFPIAISSRVKNRLDPIAVSFRIAFYGTTIFGKFKYPVQFDRAIVWMKGNVQFEIENYWFNCAHGLSALATLSKVFL